MVMLHPKSTSQVYTTQESADELLVFVGFQNENSYYVTDADYCNGVYSAVMDEIDSWTSQKVLVAESFPQEYIRVAGEEGYRITAMFYDEKNWYVFLSQGMNLKSQRVEGFPEFPAGKNEQWKTQHTFPQHIAYGDGRWWVVFEDQELGASSQRILVSADFPTQEALTLIQNNIFLHAAAYGQDLWVISACEEKVLTSQKIVVTHEFPEELIQSMWDKGYDLSFLNPGKEGWVSVFSTRKEEDAKWSDVDEADAVEGEGDENYKFKDLRFSRTTEQLIANETKYRKVFDISELTGIYVELSVYNKKFDESYWEAEIEVTVEGPSLGKKVVMLKQSQHYQISRDINILRCVFPVLLSTFASTPEAGEYTVTASINEHEVAHANFYINAVGVIDDYNPYFNFQSVRLFESDGSYEAGQPQTYLETFNQFTTRSVFCEVLIDSLPFDDWYLELFARFYDASGRLKGQVTDLKFVGPTTAGQPVLVYLGLGGKTPGFWPDKHYTIELVSMDRVVGVIPFTMADEAVEGSKNAAEITQLAHKRYHPQTNDNELVLNSEPIRCGDGDIEKELEQLNQLTGLVRVKDKIEKHVAYIRYRQQRLKHGFAEKEAPALHFAFLGNPGTGKSTVARMLGRIYCTLGLLSKGHVQVEERASLVGEYIGQTARNTKKAIDSARGGVLFIDEAYSLYRKDSDKDFGREVIETLLTELSDGPGDLAIVLAGYPVEMAQLLDFNPGLRSRLGSNIVVFEDYLPEELMEIAQHALQEMELKLDEDANRQLGNILVSSYRSRGNSFGNARFVRSLIEETRMNQAHRLMALSDTPDRSMLELIIEADLPKLITEHVETDKNTRFEIDEALLEEVNEKLAHFEGLESIKREIRAQAKMFEASREAGDFRLQVPGNSYIFRGNPGAGKKSVAALLGSFYRGIGVLEKGHMVRVTPGELVSPYPGKSVENLVGFLDKAQHGLIYFEDAQIWERMSPQAAAEVAAAIRVLLDQQRNDIVVVLSGNEDLFNAAWMKDKLPALLFSRSWQFPDLNGAQLLSITEKMVADEKLELDEEARRLVGNFFELVKGRYNRFAGNALLSKRVAEKLVWFCRIRIANNHVDPAEEQSYRKITKDDVYRFSKEFNAEMEGNRRIGFKKSTPLFEQ